MQTQAQIDSDDDFDERFLPFITPLLPLLLPECHAKSHFQPEFVREPCPLSLRITCSRFPPPAAAAPPVLSYDRSGVAPVNERSRSSSKDVIEDLLTSLLSAVEERPRGRAIAQPSSSSSSSKLTSVAASAAAAAACWAREAPPCARAVAVNASSPPLWVAPRLPLAGLAGAVLARRVENAPLCGVLASRVLASTTTFNSCSCQK